MLSDKPENSRSGLTALSVEVATVVELMRDGVAYCRMLFEDGQPGDFIFLYTNPAFEILTGLTGVAGKRVTEVVPGLCVSDPLAIEVLGRVACGGPAETFESGAFGVLLAVTVYPIKPDHVVAVFDAITGRKQAKLAEQALLQATERLALAQRAAGAGVWDWDIPTGTLTWSNELAQLFGLNPAAAVATFDAWRSVVHPEDRQQAEEVIMAAIRDHVPLFNEYRIILPGGAVRWIDVFGDTRYDADGTPQRMIGICIDASERKKAEAKIEFLAHHDHLTQLPNRFVAMERLKMAMAYADRAHENVALLFLDLDRFKAINDTLGHTIGDLLLVEVARRLQACLRETDTVSRQGGDEFLIILTHIQDIDAVTGSAAKLVAALAEPYEIEGHVLAVTTSVGIAIYPNDARNAATLMQQADTAMYHAKGRGGNDFTFFSEQMNEAVALAHALRGELRQALAGGEFLLHYQPQIDLASGRVRGVEALLRWQSPTRGLVLPEVFVSVAEDCGLIVPIGDWVLQQACQQAVRWQQAGLPELSMAVNLSAIQFRRGTLQQSVMQALTTSGLAPALLELELTESVLITEAEKAIETIGHLSALGIRFAIDDFGTGYSSLAYLKRFPIDKLKIAQIFIRDMDANPDDAAIVHAIIQMARALKLRTLAEGVETAGTAEHLQLHHCDEGQGHYFASPLPAEALQRYLLAAG